MLAVDTNVVVRLLTNDDAAQARRAAALFSSNDVFLPKSVLLETEWVLRYTYGLAPDAILHSLRSMLGLRRVTSEDTGGVQRALALFEKGLDFADALHVTSKNAVSGFATFDSKLVKRANAIGELGVTLL